MLKLNDGRNELWQWDTGRTLSVDAECSQVHFGRNVYGRSIDVDVVDGVAKVPDVLLQIDRPITAWAFVGNPGNGYTKISKEFVVNKRNKPADYVFTQEEQITLRDVIKRLEDVEENQSPEAIAKIVNDYLEENPVESPVQSVNGKTGTVNLTAGDVGALPDYTQIPTVPDWVKPIPAEVGQYFRVSAVDENGNVSAVEAVDAPSGGESYELPAATADTLGGVKAEPATEADTQPVRIGENGMLYTKPGGGVPENGEAVAAPLPMLADVASTEALNVFEVTLSKRAVKRVVMQITIPASEAVGAVCYGRLNGALWDGYIFGSTALAANSRKWLELELMEGGLAKYTVSESSGNFWSLNVIKTAGALEKISYVDSIGIRVNGSYTAPAGTRLQVWGE